LLPYSYYWTDKPKGAKTTLRDFASVIAENYKDKFDAMSDETKEALVHDYLDAKIDENMLTKMSNVQVSKLVYAKVAHITTMVSPRKICSSILTLLLNSSTNSN
jgi:hypothetical protein